VHLAYAELTLDPDSPALFVRYVAWALVAVLAGVDVGEDY